MNFIQYVNAYDENPSLRQRRILDGIFRKKRETERTFLQQENFGKRRKKDGKPHISGQVSHFEQKI